jgi:thiol-disulfide isomerase/thioredoxin
VVAVSPNDPLSIRLDELGYTDLGDTLDDIRIRARERGFKFPYLYDGETQAMSLKYGPIATPHVYVFDKARKLQFSGRIDDKEDPSKATTHDTRDAIDALLAGNPVAVPTTKVFGCSVKWADKRGSVADGLKKWAAEPVSLEVAGDAAIKEIVKNPTDKLRLVNVWATWCGPCVTEFPDLVALHRTYRGRKVEVVTISADQPDKKDAALEFLKKEQASSRNVLFEKGDPYALIELVDPEWRGALPHTILIAPGGKIIQRSEGAFDLLKVKKGIVGYLGRYYHSVPGAVAQGQ